LRALKAVIVAAGLSSRLYPLTRNTPKGLLKIGNESLLARSVRLLRVNGVSNIGVVAGFEIDAMRNALPDVEIIPNPFYRQCNNMGSLFMAKAFVAGDCFVYMHGDLIYSERMLANFLDAAQSSSADMHLLVDRESVDEEAMKVRLDTSGRFIESSKAIALDEAAGEWTGIAQVDDVPPLFNAFERHLMNVDLNHYDTAAFTEMAAAGAAINCIATNGEPWKEIDSVEDLDHARSMFEGSAN
jgi:choline kinase